MGIILQNVLLSQSSAIQIFATSAAATKQHYENIQWIIAEICIPLPEEPPSLNPAKQYH